MSMHAPHCQGDARDATATTTLDDSPIEESVTLVKANLCVRQVK